ncbi:MAG TPA: 3-hydroxyacyl-CoA dehydrogenase family protein, partial [Solirubrobacterales bacterium]|nr:3-hydroxyacyl-CoA dehydrogenase family protein [Solirubrobacterales bacterium]
PQVMPLLEVVRAERSGDDAVDLGFELGEKLGKTTVAAGDNRGFIVNRLLVPYMLDAIRAHEQGVGSIEDIDTGMMAGASHPMGPLTLADFVGLDTLAAIADVMVDAYGEERFAAPLSLREKVDAGDFGRKSGRGFYDYSGDQPVPVESGN